MTLRSAFMTNSFRIERDSMGELQVPAERISDEKYKAIRKLREHFQDL